MSTIRELGADDRTQWETLWRNYLDFYRGDVAAGVLEQTFSLMSETLDACFGLVAEADDGSLLGFAHCVVHRTTWTLGPTCYLDDLFVDPRHRGADVGRALVKGAKNAARAAGAETIYWHTQAFDGRARSLYDTVAHVTSFVHYESEL